MVELEVVHAMQIVRQLQEWINDRDGLSEIPVAHFTWSLDTLEICIGDVLVYSDQEPPSDGMSYQSCKEEWLNHVRSLLPFVEECKAV